MISLKELNPKNFQLTDEQRKNLPILHERVNIVRKLWGKAMYVTSGVRSIEDHRRIYEEKARKTGKKTFRIPMGSKHLIGAAVDISDPGLRITKWLRENPEILEQANLWAEDDTSVERIHLQSQPFGSYKPGGTRWFKP